jgi:hypothetical protein
MHLALLALARDAFTAGTEIEANIARMAVPINNSTSVNAFKESCFPSRGETSEVTLSRMRLIF